MHALSLSVSYYSILDIRYTATDEYKFNLIFLVAEEILRLLDKIWTELSTTKLNWTHRNYFDV